MRIPRISDDVPAEIYLSPKLVSESVLFSFHILNEKVSILFLFCLSISHLKYSFSSSQNSSTIKRYDIILSCFEQL